MKKMLSSGSIAMDIVVESSTLPINDGFSFVYDENVKPGGSSSNVAVSSAGFGLEVYQIGVVGDDDLGRTFRESLSGDGVSDRFLYEKNGGVTMHTYVFVVPGGSHSIFVNPGNCNGFIGPKDIGDDLIEDMDLYYTDGFSPDISVSLAKKFEKNDKPVVFNLQACPSFLKNIGITTEDIQEILVSSNLMISGFGAFCEFVANHIENKVNVDSKADKEKIKKAMIDVIRQYDIEDGMILTLGKEGSIWCKNEEFYFFNSFDVDIKDTTGAGDAFAGALIYAFYKKEMQPNKCLEFASATAAMKCRVEGARNIVSEDDVNNFILMQ